MLMYPTGAESVKCSVCHFATGLCKPYEQQQQQQQQTEQAPSSSTEHHESQQKQQQQQQPEQQHLQQQQTSSEVPHQPLQQQHPQCQLTPEQQQALSEVEAKPSKAAQEDSSRGDDPRKEVCGNELHKTTKQIQSAANRLAGALAAIIFDCGSEQIQELDHVRNASQQPFMHLLLAN